VLSAAGLTGTTCLVAHFTKSAVEQGAATALGIAVPFLTVKSGQTVAIALTAGLATVIATLNIADGADFTIS
jgi:hypothetical protein